MENIDDEDGGFGELGTCGEVLENYEPTPEQKCFAWYNNRIWFGRLACGRVCPSNPLIALVSGELWPEYITLFFSSFISFFPERNSGARYRCRYSFFNLNTWPSMFSGTSLDFNPFSHSVIDQEQEEAFQNCCIRSRSLCGLYFYIYEMCSRRPNNLLRWLSRGKSIATLGVLKLGLRQTRKLKIQDLFTL